MDRELLKILDVTLLVRPERVIPTLLQQISDEEATEMFRFLIAQSLVRWRSVLALNQREIVQIFLERGQLTAEDLTRIDKDWRGVKFSAVLHAAEHLTEHGVSPQDLSVYFWLVLDAMDSSNFGIQNGKPKQLIFKLNSTAMAWILQHRRVSKNANKIN